MAAVRFNLRSTLSHVFGSTSILLVLGLVAGHLSRAGVAEAQAANQGTPAVLLSIGATSFVLADSPAAFVQVSCNTACGLVDYRIDGAEWGTVALTQTGSYTATPFPAITPGPHSLQVFYLGNSTYAASASNAINFTVLPAGTNTPTVVASLSATSFTSSNLPNASVQVGCNSACGLVDYRIDGNEWGTVALSATGSFAANILPNVAPGAHTFQAFYLGNQSYSGSASNAINFTVLPAGTSTPTVVAFLSATSFTSSNLPNASVQVSCNSACGLVDYRIDGNEWGTVALSATGSFATNILPTVAPGAHTFQAFYLGTPAYAGSASNAINFTVLPAGSNTPTVVAFLSATSFTSGNLPNASVQVGCNSACGLVDYRIDGIEWGTVALSATGSFATNILPTVAPGAHTFQAFYLGNQSYSGSASNVISFTVLPAGSNTPTVVAFLSSTSFTSSNLASASVQVSCNSACGLVDYRIDGNEWGTVALSATGSFATNILPTVAPGAHTFQAFYLGNQSYSGSASNVINFTVLSAGTSTPTVVASLSATSFTYSNLPNASVQVSCNSACGLVDYRIDGNEWGTVALNATGSFAANILPTVAPGAHTFQAFYLGNQSYSGSASNAINFTVLPAGSSTPAVVLSMASTTFPLASSPIALVQVSCNSACGLVDYRIDGNEWGVAALTAAGSAAAYPIPTIATGVHTLQAFYLGNQSYSGSASNAVNFTVLPAEVSTPGVSASLSSTSFTSSNLPYASVQVGCNTACGLVDYLIDGVLWQTVSLSATGSFTTNQFPTIALGAHSFQVYYHGDSANEAATSNAVSFTLVSSEISATAAARFLDQATFGPTATTIAHVQQIGLAAALAEQFNQPATLFSEPPPSPQPQCVFQNYICTQSEFLNVTVWGSDQLRQRVAMALSEIWVAPVLLDNQMPFYLNVLANDAFTNYRTIMQDVTLTANMGAYLNMVNSGTPSAGQIANENFGREMMQVFTTGVNLLNQDGSMQLDSQNNPIPAYSELQVEAFARAYTGWTYANVDGSTPAAFNYTTNGQHFMVPVESQHDTTQKTLLSGVTLPAGQTAEQDLAGALDNIFAHPNVGPFVCRQLIQHLVTSAPSPGYVQRVAAVFADNGSGVRGDMKAVVTAILMDPEARSEDAQTGDQMESNPAVNGGHLREPLLWTLNLLRGLNAAQPDGNNPYPYVTFMGNLVAATGEAPFSQTSVFNYFSPQYVIPQTSLNAPEFQIENTSSVVPRSTLANYIIHNAAYAPVVDLSATSIFGQMASDPAALADYLGLIFMHNQMPTDMRTALIAEITSIPAYDPQSRVEVAVYLVITSPQYKVFN